MGRALRREKAPPRDDIIRRPLELAIYFPPLRRLALRDGRGFALRRRSLPGCGGSSATVSLTSKQFTTAAAARVAVERLSVSRHSTGLPPRRAPHLPAGESGWGGVVSSPRVGWGMARAAPRWRPHVARGAAGPRPGPARGGPGALAL